MINRQLATVLVFSSLWLQFSESSAIAAIGDGLKKHLDEAVEKRETFRCVAFTDDGWFIKTDMRLFRGGKIPEGLSVLNPISGKG